jgi:ABC-type Na+ efflux pump permease subunit
LTVHNILTIAKREIGRLRSRFRGRSGPVLPLILAGSLVLAYLVSQQGAVLGKGMYRVGVSSSSPEVQDSRFNTTTVAPAVGYSMLEEKSLDVYIEGSRVTSGDDTKSLYALGALKRQLRNLELKRITEEYDVDRAFPLRIEVNYLSTSWESASTVQDTRLQERIDTLSGNPAEPVVADSGAARPGGDQVTDAVPPSRPASQALSSQEDTDSAVRAQIRELETGGGRPRISMELTSDKEIIVPSLMNPPIPFAQVIVAFLYVLPVCFVSVFFTSSFMDEKTDRRITVLMSAPLTPFQIIAGKMLPYIGFSFASVVVMTCALGGHLLLAIAIFIPVILFIFSIYLMVPLAYRTFKDTTFISMLAVAVITSYLVFPAMFAGINDLCYISPLTLAVKMYRGESFGLKEYGFSTLPMYLVFALSTYLGTRMLNEEYLMGFRPLHRKVAEAIYLAIDRDHICLSVVLLSLFLIPLVYMVQLVMLVLQFNLPLRYTLGALLIAAVVIEEVAKSAGIVVLLKNRVIGTGREVLLLSFLSALGFLIGEKLLVYVSLSVVSESVLFASLFGSGMLLVPLAAHFSFTALVCLLTRKLGTSRYALAVITGSAVHALYNLSVMGVIPWAHFLPW